MLSNHRSATRFYGSSLPSGVATTVQRVAAGGFEVIPMNQRYDLRYLEDPNDAFGELNDPARITTIVNKNLPENEPAAYAFMNALIFNEDQLNDLESTIEEMGEPLEGARQWAQDNRDVWQPWVEAAENATQES